MTSFFASIPYNQRRKDDEREKERYFQYTFYLVLRMISCFTVFIEKQQSEGRVDCVVETPNYIYIFGIFLRITYFIFHPSMVPVFDEKLQPIW